MPPNYLIGICRNAQPQSQQRFIVSEYDIFDKFPTGSRIEHDLTRLHIRIFPDFEIIRYADNG